MWRPFTLKIAPTLIKEIKTKTKAAFPKETIAFLLGNSLGDIFHIDELYWPPDVLEHTTRDHIDLQSVWLVDAMEAAAESYLDVIGTIHSHPYKYKEALRTPDCSPSENDFKSILGSMSLLGICTLSQAASGRLRSSLRFWQPATAVEITE